MIETKHKSIDGKRVTVSQFPARRALALKIKLLKLFGPALAQMLGKVKSLTGGKLLDGSLDEFSPAIDKLTAAMEPDQFVDLVMELLAMTRIDDKEATSNFDMDFAGNLPFMYKVLFFVLEVNFGNFFGKSGIGKWASQANPAETSTPVKS